MRISYRIEELKTIIRNLGELLGVAIIVLDSEARGLAEYSPNTHDDYCSNMQKLDGFHDKCASCDKAIIERCLESSKAEFHYCHAGLCDVAMPIIKDGILAAYIILGKIRASNSPSTSDVHPDLYEKITVFTDEQLENLTNLLPYVMFDSAIIFENDSVIDDIVDVIKKLDGDLSIDALCHRFFISKSALYKSFGEKYNCTVKEFITNIRISAAADLLTNTSTAITEVAEKTGYQNYSCFCKAFKKHFGISPSDYRKNKKSKIKL